MRTINKAINITKVANFEVTATVENIVAINENKSSRIVLVVTEYKDVDGTALKQENIEIMGGDYDLLMQSNPSYAPHKPENEYRESDLWHIIDLIRNR